MSTVNFNLRYYFWTMSGGYFIFGMHTPLIKSFQINQGQWPCDLDYDLFCWKKSFLNFIATGAFVSRSLLSIINIKRFISENELFVLNY